MDIIYEDNHIIIVSKSSSEIVQGDKTGDTPLSELVKQYIKETYAKPGEVFLGVVHRLDRPVSGLVVFARTSKALTRLNAMFAQGEVHKTYWAIVRNMPPKDHDTLVNWMVRNEKQNKSYAYDREVPHSKRAELDYAAPYPKAQSLGCGRRAELIRETRPHHSTALRYPYGETSGTG